MNKARGDAEEYSDERFLHELEPVAASLMDRHLANARDWFPHEMIRWSAGQDYAPGEELELTESSPPEAARSALFLNLLTEDNLYYYYGDSLEPFGKNDAWGEWARRWTAEEGRHGIVIRDYVIVHKLLDGRALEHGRMAQVSRGEVPLPPTPAELAVYATLQELATRISHSNTGRLMPEGTEGRQVMARVAGDENLHYNFYLGITKEAVMRYGSTMVQAIARQITGFKMPGTGVPDFIAHATRIADAGIYTRDHFLDDIVGPVLAKELDFWNLENLSPDAEKAREDLHERIDRLKNIAAKEREKRERRHQEALDTGKPPIILLRKKSGVN